LYGNSRGFAASKVESLAEETIVKRPMVAALMVGISMMSAFAGGKTVDESAPAKAAVSMVIKAGYGPHGGKEEERFTLNADGSFQHTQRTFGAKETVTVMTGSLKAEQVEELRKAIADAGEGAMAEDAGTVVFKWTDKAGKQQERLYMLPRKSPAKELVAKVRALVKAHGKESGDVDG
jgi:hypothetical protein